MQDEQPQHRTSAQQRANQKLSTNGKVGTQKPTQRQPQQKRATPFETNQSQQQKPRPKTARQAGAADPNDPLIRPSEKHAFSDADATIEHLMQEVAIFKQKAIIVDDIRNQNETLQQQIEAAYQTNEQQLHVNEQQAELIIAQADQINALNDEKNLLVDQVQELQDLRVQHQEQMEDSSKYQEKLEEKICSSNQVSLELLKQIRDMQHEIETLKNYAVELKAKVAVYVPIKNDPVDEKLAEFVNNYPDRSKLRIMFLRESSGVYEFGTKRVKVEVTKNKILIRVGGGFISIDEFLQQYTPLELEKLERRDPLKRFSEKVALAKTIQGKDIVVPTPIEPNVF